MKVLRVADGLWRWTAYYEEWRDDVGCDYYEAPDAIVLIDPLVPAEPSEAARFWEALDRDVKRADVPVHVLDHGLLARTERRRYRASLRRAAARRQSRPRGDRAPRRMSSPTFRPGEPLPGGIEALPSGRATEVVYWIPEHAALVPGDVILGADDNGLRLCPESWLPAGVDHAKLRAALEPLLDLPVERVLVSHGEPVLVNARPKLAAALQGR